MTTAGPDPTEAYQRMADWFDRQSGTSICNAYYDRPAMLRLLGDVAGEDVLDAGCGPGRYLLDLLDRGARVVGIDGTPAMIELARRRLGDRATLHHHDLNRPLDMLADASFDAAVLALVLQHIDDRAGLLRELFRVLRPGGRLAVSTEHPTAAWQRLGGSYFTVERELVPFNRGAYQVPQWRMPLSTLLDEFLAPGFTLQRLVEPTPDPAILDRDPAAYHELARQPAFLMTLLRRP